MFYTSILAFLSVAALVVILDALLILFFSFAGKEPRIGVVLSWTRCLFGVDYDTGLIAFHCGPIAFCIAWGPTDANPFISQDDLDKMAH